MTPAQRRRSSARFGDKADPRHPPQTPFGVLSVLVRANVSIKPGNKLVRQANVLLKERILNNDRFVGIGRQHKRDNLKESQPL